MMHTVVDYNVFLLQAQELSLQAHSQPKMGSNIRIPHGVLQVDEKGAIASVFSTNPADYLSGQYGIGRIYHQK